MNALTWLVLLTSITSSSEVASTTSITSSGVASVAERSAAESGSCRLPVVPHKAQQGLPKTQVIYSNIYVCVWQTAFHQTIDISLHCWLIISSPWKEVVETKL